MSNLTFISSLVASLVWPIVVIVVLVLFRKPFADLIVRLRSYKGMGQEVEFGERLAMAEESARLAIKNVSESVESEARELPEQLEAEPRLLIHEAEKKPSYVIIRAWEDLELGLTDLAGVVFPGRPMREGITRLLADLETKDTGLAASFYDAVREFHDLRDRVAHGDHNPTPGEAIAYAQSINRLIMTARFGIYYWLEERKPEGVTPDQ
jgi:hypothetical protein